MPQVVWSDMTPWRLANLWARTRVMKGVDFQTVDSDMDCLRAYADWLEETHTDWRSFPRREEDRCLVKYRAALKKKMKLSKREGGIATSTASKRINVAIRFYRWIQKEGLFTPGGPMWTDKVASIRIFDRVGFERTIAVTTTDLAIPNRKRTGERLEDGLLPVSAADRDAILAYTRKEASEELFQMLSCGFFTGMRLGSIADLKVQTLERAVPDPSSPELFRLAIGPGADPPVATKFDVTGHAWIARAHLVELLNYARSVRRLKREAIADKGNKDLVFLTRFGGRYASPGTNRSSAINVEMHKLRERGKAAGIAALRDFHFHMSRPTFATELAQLALQTGVGPVNAVALVKEALLHRDEVVSFRYIKFAQKTRAKAAMADQFTQEFLGLLAGRVPHSNA